MEAKYIVGMLFIALGVGAYFLISSLTSIPFLSFLVSLGGIVIGLILAITGILMMILPKAAMGWLIGLSIILPATIVLWIVPDPIPFVDEIVTSLLTLFFATKSFSAGKESGGAQLELF